MFWRDITCFTHKDQAHQIILSSTKAVMQARRPYLYEWNMSLRNLINRIISGNKINVIREAIFPINRKKRQDLVVGPPVVQILGTIFTSTTIYNMTGKQFYKLYPKLPSELCRDNISNEFYQFHIRASEYVMLARCGNNEISADEGFIIANDEYKDEDAYISLVCARIEESKDMLTGTKTSRNRKLGSILLLLMVLHLHKRGKRTFFLEASNINLVPYYASFGWIPVSNDPADDDIFLALTSDKEKLAFVTTRDLLTWEDGVKMCLRMKKKLDRSFINKLLMDIVKATSILHLEKDHVRECLSL